MRHIAAAIARAVGMTAVAVFWSGLLAVALLMITLAIEAVYAATLAVTGG